MAKFRQVYASFWTDPDIEDISPENKLFFICLLTNPDANMIGIYEITKKRLSFYTGYDMTTIDSLVKRFIAMGKILYDEDTRELCILNFVKYNLKKGGKPMWDGVESELKKVKNKEFIRLVADEVPNETTKQLFNKYGIDDDTSTSRERIGDKTETDRETDTDTEKETNKSEPPPPKIKPFIKNPKKEISLPPGFSERLIEYLEEPGTPDFFWECIEEVVSWGNKKNVFIDWVSIDGFKRNRKAIASIFSKLRIAAGLDGTGDGLQKQVKIFLSKPDQWWYDNGISLEKLDKNFDSIYNSKNGKSKRDDKPEASEYKSLAEQSKKGRLLI